MPAYCLLGFGVEDEALQSQRLPTGLQVSTAHFCYRAPYAALRFA